jgi:RNA polymerase sigma factor (sigma-70 family)
MATQNCNPVLRHIRLWLDGRPADEHSDSHLLQRFVTSKDQAAFSALVQRHGAMVFGLCRRLLHSEHDAEDAFQVAFLVLAQKAADIREHRSLAVWLHEVAFHIALRAKTAASRRQILEQQARIMTPTDPSAELARRELRSALDQELRQLPEKYRGPLILCYLEGHTHQDIARRLGWPAGSIWSRLARGRDLLRRRLARRGIVLSAGVLTTTLAEEAAMAMMPSRLVPAVVEAAVVVSLQGLAAGKVSATVAALVQGRVQEMFLSRLHLPLVLLLAVTGAGVGALAYRPSALPAALAEDKQAKAAARDVERPSRVDLYGDPLPEGALARLGTTRLRHGDMVRNLGFSRDGKWLLSADWHSVCRWDAATGRLLGQFGDPRGRQFQSIAFSADAGTVALSMDEGDVDIFEAASGRRLAQFRVQRFPSVELSPDGKILAVLEVDKNDKQSLFLIDIAADKELHRLTGHSDRIHQFLFSADGKTVVSTSDDRTIRFWDVASGKQVRKLDALQPCGHIALSPDGKYLACVTVTKSESANATMWRQGEEVLLWDLASGRVKHRLTGHGWNGVAAMAFAPDSQTLVTCDWQTTHWWDLATGKEQLDRRFAAGRAVVMAFSTDGRTLATGGSGQTVQTWDVATLKEKLPYRGHPDTVHSAAISPDGKTLATGCGDGIIRLWDTTGAERGQLRGHEKDIWSLAFIPDGRLVSVGLDQTVRLWEMSLDKNAATPQSRTTAAGNELRRLRLRGQMAVVAPDCKRLVSADEKTLYLWDLTSSKELSRWAAPKGGALPVVFAPDGRVVCTWGADHVVRLWDVTSGKELRHFSGHHFAEDSHDRIYCVAFSPDGRLVAFGGQASAIVLYDMATGEEVRRLSGLPGAVSSLAFSADSKTLASGDWTGGTVRLWEVATGQQFRALPGHQGRIFHIAFSNDGNVLLTANEDTTALLWNLSGPRTPGYLTAQQLKSLWEDLVGPDVIKAQEAAAVLATVPVQAVPFLREHLHAVPPPDTGLLPRLLANLDNEDFSVRERAANELDRLGEAAELVLRRAVTTSTSVEVRERAKRLLLKLEPSAERLRALRALQVLERAGTREAQDLLKRLAGGASQARLTQEANDALQRLAGRSRPQGAP